MAENGAVWKGLSNWQRVVDEEAAEGRWPGTRSEKLPDCPSSSSGFSSRARLPPAGSGATGLSTREQRGEGEGEGEA